MGWYSPRGTNTVGLKDGVVIGIINNGKLRPIYTSNGAMITIRLLGLHRIEIPREEEHRYPFGRNYRRTTIVNFVRQPDAQD